MLLLETADHEDKTEEIGSLNLWPYCVFRMRSTYGLLKETESSIQSQKILKEWFSWYFLWFLNLHFQASLSGLK